MCQSDRADFVCERPDGLTVRLCPACRLYYVSPAPSAARLDAFYARYDEDHRRWASEGPAELARLYRTTHPLADARLRELSSLRDLRGARVLDVGFGRARVLFDALRLGAVPSGVDLDPKAIELAKSLGIQDVRRGTIADLDPAGRFDVVFLNDLVEHPLDPLPLVRDVVARLAPGGLLVVSTPNGEAAERDPERVTFRVDLEHMQYFTPASLANLAARVGLEIVHLETMDFPDLEDFERPHGSAPSLRSRARSFLFSLPGFGALNRVRRALATPFPKDERLGSYRLLAILEKRTA
jgi:2-polyprenyl-3-methyl-5-hydroxy-6-metoxy-1,4-benzoquinol methylase